MLNKLGEIHSKTELALLVRDRYPPHEVVHHVIVHASVNLFKAVLQVLSLSDSDEPKQRCNGVYWFEVYSKTKQRFRLQMLV